jgi:hypothetical protein
MSEITENQRLRNEAHRHAERIAVELENTARRIRQEARGFENEKQDASAVAADVISVYVQNGGTVGAIVWQLIRDLSATR